VSKYTTEVRYICETLAGDVESTGFDNIENIISKSRDKVFNFNYPIFDPTYRVALETKILKHFYTREIAHETVGLWKLKLSAKMNEIMPYYNQLYKSELLVFNPLYDVDYTNKKDDTKTKTSNSTENTTHSTTGSATSKVTDSNTLHDDVTKTLAETDTNSGTIKNGGTVKDTGTVENGGTVTDSATTTNNTTDATTATNTVDKTGSESKMDALSQTPQGAITDLESYKYLTEAKKGTNSNEDNETTKINQSLKKTGTVDEDKTTTTDTTQTNNLTSTTDLTQTNNLTSTKSGTDITSGTTTKSGEVNNTASNSINGTVGVTGSDTIVDVDSYLETVKGKQGTTSYSELLIKFRETFMNIDMMVINELNELFFNLW
jgi:hypothetical protein